MDELTIINTQLSSHDNLILSRALMCASARDLSALDWPNRVKKVRRMAQGSVREIAILMTTGTAATQPLRYHQAEHGYMVYSVGPDHQDNGGLIDPPGKGPRPKEMDIGFRVERTFEK